MKVCCITILIFLFCLSLNLHLQAQGGIGNKIHYLKLFEEAETLIKKHKYIAAENILKELNNKNDIDITGCSMRSEISNLLGVCRYKQHDIISAFKIWKEETLPLRLKCDSIDPERLAQTLYNIGYAFNRFYDYSKSIVYINKAIDILKQNRLLNKKKYINYYLIQHYNFKKLRDYNLAQGYVFKALELADSIQPSDLEKKGNIYNKIGRNFILKKEYNLAKEYLLKAEVALEKSKSPKRASLYRNYIAYYSLIDDYQESLKWSNIALKYIENNKIINQETKYLIDESIGLTLVAKGDYKKALSYYFKSLNNRLESNAGNSSLSNIYENIAGAYGRLEKLDSALFYIDLSIEKNHSLSSISDLDKSKYKDLMKNDFGKSDMVRKLQMKGKFLNRKFKKNKDIVCLLKADSAFVQLDSIVFLLRKEIDDNNSKILLGISLDTIYKYAIDNAYTLWETTHNQKYLNRAYKFIGENKAVVFSETKEELDAVWEILEPKIRNKYLSILDDLKSNLYQKQYAVLENDSLAYQRLSAEFLNLTKQKDKVYNEIKTKYPGFFQQIYGNLYTKTIKELQDKLSDDNAVLEYYIAENKLYTFVITKHKYFAIKQKLNMDINTLFNDFGKELTYYTKSKKIIEQSKIIYPILFPAKLNKFLNQSEIKRLIVIRDKNLNKIPFGAIMTGENMKEDFLIFKYSFSYSFNNKYIWKTNPIKETKEYEFEGFATNYNEKTLKEIAKDSIFWTGPFPPNLKPLRLSIAEVQSIGKLFRSKIWIGKQADYKNFIENANKCDMLHLSLHSLIATNNNEQNGIIFQKTSKNNKFILKSSDLIGLRLNNSLSILSSCYSSDGSVITGEGINSLARSFSLAGSPAIIASQWQAYEGQTKDILVLFYKNIKKGYSKDIALQKAKQTYINQVKEKYLAPANWANLVLLGDPSIIYHRHGIGDYLLIFLAFVIVVLILIFGCKKIKACNSK